MTIQELRDVYSLKRTEIKKRLGEFRDIGRTASDERLFEELVFCIFTAAASARMGIKAVERVRPVLITGSLEEIREALKRTHRFPNTRAGFAFSTRQYLSGHCQLRMRNLLSGIRGRDARRDFFAANPGIRGLGYKEASHYLRNIGYRGYAILDKHVLGRLAEFGIVSDPRPPSTKRTYVEAEKRMREFSDRIGLDFDELDLLLWYTKTGEILK